MPDTVCSSPSLHNAQAAPGRTVRPMFLGWLVILLCSLLLYDALLYASLRAEIRENARASASVAAASLKSSLTMGVRFGKNLRTFRGIDRLLETAGRAANRPLAVFDARGTILHTWQYVPPLEKQPQMPLSGAQELLVETETGSVLLMPVLDRDNATAGFVGAWVDRAALEDELHTIFKNQMLRQLGIACAGALLFMLCLALQRGSSADTRFRRLGIGLFLVVMLCNGVLAIQAVSRHYTQGLNNDAAHTGQLLTGSLNRLLLVGVSLDKTTRLDAYLAGIAAIHNNAIALDILDPRQQRFASSRPEGDDAERLPEVQTFKLLEHSGAFSLSGAPLEQGWTLRVSLLRAPWMDKLINAGLDILTLVAIALIFMMEMFLLLSRSLGARASGQLESYAHRSAMFRPLMFVFVLAMDMSVSFIPLRMAELTAPGALSRDMLLGLPISAEMGMTGLSVLIAGSWMKRRGARPPLMTGIACMALGYLGSMLAQAPWQFVIARAVVGLGYGLSLLTAQAYTVKDGRLADMFAGVYAGSLCGSALGAMLAERLGYGPVFLLSACILACLFFVPLKMLRGDNRREAAPGTETPAARLTFSDIRRLLADRRFLAFVLLALLPSAIVCVGFLNYFLPTFLKQADVAQSNIGRVYMLNCLIVIYSGPLLTALVQKTSCRAGLLCVAGLLTALSAFSFTLLPPLPAAIAGSVLLGLATGLNIPAQSVFLLDLDIARAIGVDQAMSLLDALQRVGQVIGPLCVGAALAVMSVDEAALGASLALVAVSLLLPLLAGSGRRSCRSQPPRP